MSSPEDPINTPVEDPRTLDGLPYYPSGSELLNAVGQPYLRSPFDGDPNSPEAVERRELIRPREPGYVPGAAGCMPPAPKRSPRKIPEQIEIASNLSWLDRFKDRHSS